MSGLATTGNGQPFLHPRGDASKLAPIAKSLIDMKKENCTPCAKVSMTICGKVSTHQVKYVSLEQLSEKVFNLCLDKCPNMDSVIITLPDGKNYHWNDVIAHYCFAKGRITVEEFVSMQFKEEVRI